MKLIIKSGIILTQEQVLEIASLMDEPDMGWSYNEYTRKNDLRHYVVHLDGEYAKYQYIVNVGMNIIRLVKVIPYD